MDGNVDAHLSVTVTPFSGDPDVYVSNNNPRPNSTSYTSNWASSAFSTDTVTISKNDPNFCVNCYYYIGVFGYWTSTFTVTATFGTEEQLAAGVVVDSSLTTHQWDYYYYTLQAPLPGPLDINLQAWTGSPTLYVSTVGEPRNVPGGFNYSTSSRFSQALLTVDTYAACASQLVTSNFCELHVGVYGTTASSYSLLVGAGKNIQLANGKSYQASLARGQVAYFVARVPSPGMDLLVAVTPINGDPDLYVSSVNPYPNGTYGSYNWSSSVTGADGISVHNAAPGLYYIGVVAYSTSRFSIAAYTVYENATNVPIQLADGVPQSGMLGSGDIAYYQYTLDQPQPELTISTTKTLGDPDIFVTIDGSLPNTTNHQYSSTAWGSDVITIRNPPLGTYIIGVYGYSTTFFSIAAVSGSLELAENIAFQEDLTSGQSEYFHFNVIDHSRPLTISVTSFNGDPDLFISAIDQYPSYNATWSARSYRNDSVTIPISQLVGVNTLYIAVQAWTNCSFSIVATYSNFTWLTDGVPQADTISKEASRFYYFLASSTGISNDISFSVSPSVGNVRLYVSNGTDIQWDNPSTYQWSSIVPWSSQLVIVRFNDTSACHNRAVGTFCRYVVSVRGMTDATYSVQAITSLKPTELQSGVPIRSSVAARVTQYFSFLINQPGFDVSISLSALTGDPDLYVSTAPQPGPRNYNWSSLYWGGDMVQIQGNDVRLPVGRRLYIGVYGSTFSNFAIMASMTQTVGNITVSQIVDGLPLTGRLWTPGTYQYYKYIVSDPSMTFTFSVSTRIGNPNLYLRYDGQLPLRNFSQIQSENVGGDTLVVPGSAACTNWNGPGSCVFYLGVYAATPTLFTVTVQSGVSVVQMASGTEYSNHLNQGETKYYSIFVDSYYPQLVVSMTALSGDPDIYISAVQTYPNASAEWRSLEGGSDTITIDNPRQIQYNIAVVGFTNASFILTANLGPITLSPGSSYSDSLQRNDIRTYNIDVDVSPETRAQVPNGLSIYVNLASNGAVDLYLKIYNNSFATPTDWKWKSTQTDVNGGRFILIRSDDLDACWSCSYSLAVKALSHVHFSIVAFTGDTTLTLEPGRPTYRFVSKGNYTYFRAVIDQLSDISVSVVEFVGDTTVLIAQNVTNPSLGPGQSTWKIPNNPNGHANSLTIRAADYQRGFLYIAVYGNDDSSFSITVTTGETVLVPGQPQVLGCYGTPQYFLLNFDPAQGTKPSDILFTVATQFTWGQKIPTYNLYIVNDPEITTTPNATNAQIAFRNLADGATSKISSTNQYYCASGCTYYVALECSASALYSTFTLTASTSDVLDVLFLDQEASYLAEFGQTKYYLSYLSTGTNYSVVLDPCFGETDLYVSSSVARPNPVNGFDQRLVNDGSPREYAFFSTVSHASYYYGAAPRNGIAATYTIRTSFLDSPFNTKSPVVASKTLTTSSVSNYAVKLSFAAASSRTGKAAGALTYTVFWSKQTQDTPIMYTKCGYDLVAAQSPDRAVAGVMNVTVSANINGGDNIDVVVPELDDTAYIFNVLVQDYDQQSNTWTYLLYQPSAATPGGAPSGGGGKPSYWFLAIVIPLGIILVAGLVWLYIKNRRLTKELQIEMHDVPKAAVRKAVRAGGATGVEGYAQVSQTQADKAAQAKSYDRLLEEDDPAESAYHPPAGTSDGLAQL